MPPATPPNCRGSSWRPCKHLMPLAQNWAIQISPAVSSNICFVFQDGVRDLRVQYAPVEVPLHDILLNSAGQFCLTCNKKVCIHAAGTLAVDLFAGSLRAGSSSDCPSSRQLKSLLTALNPRIIFCLGGGKGLVACNVQHSF